MFTIQFYETEDGSKPVYEFLLSLDPKMGAMTELLAEKGNELRKPYTEHREHLDDGIFELRAIQGKIIYPEHSFSFI